MEGALCGQRSGCRPGISAQQPYLKNDAVRVGPKSFATFLLFTESAKLREWEVVFASLKFLFWQVGKLRHRGPAGSLGQLLVPCPLCSHQDVLLLPWLSGRDSYRRVWVSPACIWVGMAHLGQLGLTGGQLQSSLPSSLL